MNVRELRVVYVHRSMPVTSPPVLTTPREAAALLSSLLASEPVEVFGMLCLSTRHTVLCYHEVARGTLDTVPVHPRETFKAALLSNAACVLVAHNHPSGDPTPSHDDMELTRRLTAAGALLGIDVVDHIIVGAGRHYSFREMGRL